MILFIIFIRPHPVIHNIEINTEKKNMSITASCGTQINVFFVAKSNETNHLSSLLTLREILLPLIIGDETRGGFLILSVKPWISFKQFQNQSLAKLNLLRWHILVYEGREFTQKLLFWFVDDPGDWPRNHKKNFHTLC